MVRAPLAGVLGAAFGCATIGALAPSATAVSPGSLQPGLTWVVRAPDATTNVLYRVGPSGLIDQQPVEYAVNAIGCAPDQVLYGLAASRQGVRFTGGPHLLRIDAGGAVVDLGHIDPGTLSDPLARAYGATVRTDGGSLVLLVNAGAAEVRVRISPGPPGVVGSQALPPLPYVGDWDADATGDLYTVVGGPGGAELLRLDRTTLAATSAPLPGLPGNSGYGGVALTVDGVLYAVDNRLDGTGALYRVPVNSPAEAIRVLDLGPIAASDAALCAESPPPSTSPSVVPRPVPPVAGGAAKVSRRSVPRSAPVVAVASSSGPGAVVSGRAPATRPRRQSAAAPQPLLRSWTPGLRLVPVLAGIMAIVLIAIRLTRSSRRGDRSAPPG